MDLGLSNRIRSRVKRNVLGGAVAALSTLFVGANAADAQQLVFLNAGNPTTSGSGVGERAIWEDSITVGGVLADLVVEVETANLDVVLRTVGGRPTVQSRGQDDHFVRFTIYQRNTYNVSTGLGGIPLNADVFFQINDVDGPNNEQVHAPVCGGNVQFVRIDQNATTDRAFGTVAGRSEIFSLIGDRNYNNQPESGLELSYGNTSTFDFGRTANNGFLIRLDNPSYSEADTLDFECADFVPPNAVDDEETGAPGAAVSVSVLDNDSIATANDNGPNNNSQSPSEFAATSVSLVAPSGATGVTTDSTGDVVGFTVPGEGTWAVDEVTGDVTFTPEAGFTGDPTPVDYTFENALGISSPPATITITYPQLEVTKSIASVTDDGDGRTPGPGDTINYTFTVNNPGTIDLTNVTITDSLAPVSGGPLASLPAGTSNSSTFTSSYVIQSTDLTEGGVENTATGNAQSTAGPVTDVSDAGTDENGDPVANNETTETDALDPTDNDGDPTNDPTVLEISFIDANDDTPTDVFETNTDIIGAINVLDDNGSGPDTINGSPTSTTEVTVTPIGTLPTGITLNPDGTVDIAEGTAAGTVTFDYEICEIADPTNCDTATVTLQLGSGGIGVVKSSVFNDENGDGAAQVGETITYEYSVTNQGTLDLSTVTLTETGFTGTGTTPAPTLQSGDDGDDILQTTETWIYEATYVLTADDIAAGGVDNQATAEAETPDGTTVSDLSDSSNSGDGDGTGTPGDGPNNDDPTGTPLTSLPIDAIDDVVPASVDGPTGQTGVINVYDNNGGGVDTLNNDPTDATNTTVAPNATNPPPAGITINPDGSVDVAAGTTPGTYTFSYDLCETANPLNCDTATITLTIAEGEIGVVKAATFNDESGDGNAQVGETITYTYTVTNEGGLPLSNVSVTETGFTGTGTAPTPLLQSGDDGDSVLQTTETWVYSASYALTQADIDAGMVDNSATASGQTPGGATVSDVSDSTNPSDGDGTGTPGPGPNNDDPTSTPLSSSTITAQNDVATDPVDPANPSFGVIDIFDDNGNGADSLNGSTTDSTAVTVSADPSNPVPAGLTLNPDGTVDVAAGTTPGTYTFGYEICEIGNTSNCDTATVTLTVGEGGIGVVKASVFNDENADTHGQVGETITYTYTVTNEGNLSLNPVTLTETGFTGAGAPPMPSLISGDDGDGVLEVGETWTYRATYTLVAADLVAGGVDNQATANGQTPGGTPVSDVSDSSNPADGDGTGTPGPGPNNDDPTGTPLTSAPIVAQDDTLTPPIDANTPQTNVLNVFDDNGSGPDTLNGAPTDETEADVEIVLTSPPPSGITLNPDGSVDIDAGTPPGVYSFDYEICEIANPANCDTATITLEVGEGQIAVVKSAVFNDDVIADGNGQVGETITYTYTVTNPGSFDLTSPTLTETGFTGAGTTPSPSLTGGDDGDGVLEVGETWTYMATYTIVAADLTAGGVENQATASGTTPNGATVSDLSDSTNPGDGNGVGTPDSGPGNDDPTSTPFTNATIAANDDVLPDPVDANVAIPAILNVLDPNGVGAADELNGSAASTTGADPVVISADPSNPVPAGFTLNADGTVDVAAGTAPGTYTFGYEICEALNPTNCDTAIVEITIGGPAVGIVKTSTFNDENFDGFAQVGETITYTYAVSNEGNLPLNSVDVTETSAGFTGAGTLPSPSFVSGDDGDTILEETETWFYSATYTLVAADITGGGVNNLAQANAQSPAGEAVSDLSDSGNPGDGDGSATPGTGTGNDDPTVTTLPSAPIVAEDDTASGIDGLNGQTNVLNVLSDNGVGADTLGGTAVTPTRVDISVVTPATPIGSNPVPVLDPATGSVDVPAGTPAGSYDITYEICETLNPTNCDTAVVTIVVDAPPIDAVDNDFTAVPFDGEDGDTTPSVFANDTLDNRSFDPATEITASITDPDGLTGAVLNPDGTITIPPGTPAGLYQVEYEICDALNPTNCDTAVASIQVGTVAAVAEDFDTINGGVGGTTPSVLTSDTLNGAPITDPNDVVLSVVSATGGLTLDPATNGILVPPGTPAGSYTLTYQICDATNPAICSQVTETVTVGTIVAAPENFPPVAAGDTTPTSVLESDTLNGNPATLDDVTLTLISTDPVLTLNPDGTITVAPDAPAGLYELVYEICDIDNPNICARITEPVNVIPEPDIEVIKTQEFVDNGDGLDGIGDTLNYTITVTNTGNVDLAAVNLVDTMTNGNGDTLTLTSGPTFQSSTEGSGAGGLVIGEVATYTASYVLLAADVSSGVVSNSAVATGAPIAPVGYTGDALDIVRDMSDEGNPANGEDDPTVYNFFPNTFADGLTITKTSSVTTVRRGQVVPYTLTLTNANPTSAVSAITVDSLPAGFVYVDGSATLNGIAITTVEVVGRIVSFPTLILPAGSTSTIELSARILGGAEVGEKVNKANLLDPNSGEPIAPQSTASVFLQPEPVFDCGDVIGKVFDDENHNGYQDQGEPGLPAVRIAGVDGTIITTDEYGRYHVPCAALPESSGSNFILKVDERSLPTGYRLTTENPRVIRLTRGKMSEMNFGASISRVVRVDVNSKAFTINDAGRFVPVPELMQGIDKLLVRIKPEPSTLRIAFHLPDDPSEKQKRTARKLNRELARYIRKRWRKIGDYKLNIETTFVRRK